MALAFYDDTQTLFGANPLRTVHDGFIGGVHEEKTYVRNADAAKYYDSVQLRLYTAPYADSGVLGNSGWSVKFLYGERRPTEAEWDLVTSGESLDLPDIGATGAADTTTYHPVWVRVYCPGNEPAQYRENQFMRLYYLEKTV